LAEDKCPRNNNGNTPLHVSAMYGHVDTFNFIMSVVENKNPTNNIGLTPLHFAAFSGHLAICEAIIDKLNNWEINPRSNDGRTPLHFAAMKGHLHICKKLITTLDQSGLYYNIPKSNQGRVKSKRVVTI